ncbi:MAG TPA: cryptochrome/photolyase family protein, partial [Gammaproteobacteria bacterium]|nr:cryptochrome/photolyase family protein [Gammaproteobacteria bacterium]
MTNQAQHQRRGLFLILPGQCFPMRFVKPWRHWDFLLSEWAPNLLDDQHHQLKLVMMIQSLRSYAKELRTAGAKVIYHSLNNECSGDFPGQLERAVLEGSFSELAYFEIEDGFCVNAIADLAKSLGLNCNVVPSPMFLCSREVFADYLKNEPRPRMASFYKMQRKDLNLLLTSDGKPLGGKWSLDAENRKPLPKTLIPPAPGFPQPGKNTREVMALVKSRFAAAPGDADLFCYPATRYQAERWLTRFIDERLASFGDYEDALTTRSDTVYHSLISPLLNLGLLTPADVIRRVMRAHHRSPVPLNSLEGFVRQVIGWREFIRGVYHHFGVEQSSANFFGHRSELTDHWYDGSTGITPLDHVIRKTQRWGWAHHIERLMVVA